MISGLLKGQVQANSFIASNKSAGRDGGQRRAGHADRQEPEAGILAAAFQQITFTNDPIASSLIADAQHAVAVGLLTPVKNLTALYDLGPLNKLLAAAGQPQVSS